MAINSQITRITQLRNRIRNHLVNWGLVETSADLEDLTDALEGVSNQGAVSSEVKEGETYTIPAGYHNGSGTVRGVAGGGNYSLQDKGSVTPTKAQQSITPDNGYYGISAVVVEAIPEAYQDVSSVDAAAADVLANKKFVASDGTLTAGEMVNNGAVSKTLTVEDNEYTVPAGYHNGQGKVQIVGEAKSATPGAAAQTITASEGKVLSQVQIAAIDADTYKDTTDATVSAADLRAGVTAYGKDAEGKAVKITGSMVDNGAISATIDGLTNTSYTVPAGYTSGGSVSLTDDIETALAGI